MDSSRRMFPGLCVDLWYSLQLRSNWTQFNASFDRLATKHKPHKLVLLFFFFLLWPGQRAWLIRPKTLRNTFCDLWVNLWVHPNQVCTLVHSQNLRLIVTPFGQGLWKRVAMLPGACEQRLPCLVGARQNPQCPWGQGEIPQCPWEQRKKIPQFPCGWENSSISLGIRTVPNFLCYM